MYNHKEIEKKWQNYWSKNKTFKTDNFNSKEKYYVLDMFPYPSGAWLHVGHPKWYTANDIIARYKNAKWLNVLHPMWWDAFWLPAENYAIKTWIHPKITTQENINIMKEQIMSLGISYDWDREIDTTDPKYYKWTQWIFLKMFEAGLAYEQDLPINFCPSCKTWLANEEVLSNWTCERCGTNVEKRKIRQWVLAITKYADRLAWDVEDLDWPEGIKDMQRQWIWRSEWCEFEMKKFWDDTKSIRVYTTRIDTVFGMTYAVIAPDHPKINDFIENNYEKEVNKYIKETKNKPELDRTWTNKDKTWVFTGTYIVNPFSWEKIPLWVADYVLWNYWTWAVMAVPAHDERDHEFALKYSLDIKQSIEEEIICEAWDKNKCITTDWMLVNSWEFSNLTSKDARIKLVEYAIEKWFWEKKVNYKLRDWLFSRQRYWGEPIPLIHLKVEDLKKLPHISSIQEATDKNIAYILKREAKKWEENCENAKCNWMIRELIIWWKVFSKIYDWIYSKIICDYNLPLELPEVDAYEPAWDWQSPLAKVSDFVNIKLAPNLNWTRETNTMPQWWGSCWYYLRFMDTLNDKNLVWKEVEEYWQNVDSYVGWAEHAVLHLLYARFWHKFLYDIWVVSTKEPFAKLRNQWMILAYAYETKEWWLVPVDLVEEKDEKYYHKETKDELNKIVAKMSKSLKNVVNPNDIIDEFWADSLRLYEMYISDFRDSAPWDTKNIIWVRRFLDKVWWFFEVEKIWKDDNESMKLLHKTIKKVWSDIENYKFNTAIASLMILVNYWHPKDKKLKDEWLEKLLILIHPFAPHITEELWEKLGNNKSIFLASWPNYDEVMTIDDEIEIAIQVLGKLRWTIIINKDENKESVLIKAKENEEVKKWIEWKEIVKEIYVPWKIVNLVIK